MHRPSFTSAAVAALGATALLATAAVAATSGPTVKTLKVTQTGNKAVVRVTTAGFKLSAAAQVGKANVKGVGHEHFQLDNGKYDQPKYSGANGALAKKLGVNGLYSPSLTNVVTYTGLPKGKHKITVFLVNNDHSNYATKSTKHKCVVGSGPAACKTSSFTVK